MHVFVVEERPDPSEEWSITAVFAGKEEVREYFIGQYEEPWAGAEADEFTIHDTANPADGVWVTWDGPNLPAGEGDQLARASYMEVL